MDRQQLVKWGPFRNDETEENVAREKTKYPASLFMGNQSVFSTLGDHANWIGFWSVPGSLEKQ